MYSSKNKFINIVENSKVILGQGGILETIRRNYPSTELDPYIAHAGLIYNKENKKFYQKFLIEYIDIGKEYNLPFFISAPTWRANPDRIKKSSFRGCKTINQDNVNTLKNIRRQYGDYAKSIFIAGVMGCKGDAYCPHEALSSREAEGFHAEQALTLAESGVDFIKVGTLPAISEAYGIASAISKCKVPYIISFIVRPNGFMLDGTPLHKAVELIDSEIRPRPICYMLNCIHPTIFREAIENEQKHSEGLLKRVIGIQANSSPKSPEELDKLTYLDTTAPEEFGELMVSLHKSFGTKILAGCCGTDERHIRAIAKRINKIRELI